MASFFLSLMHSFYVSLYFLTFLSFSLSLFHRKWLCVCGGGSILLLPRLTTERNSCCSCTHSLQLHTTFTHNRGRKKQTPDQLGFSVIATTCTQPIFNCELRSVHGNIFRRLAHQHIYASDYNSDGVQRMEKVVMSSTLNCTDWHLIKQLDYNTKNWR